MYQFGNGEPCFTKAAIKESVAGFFASIDALYHDVRNVWELGDVVFVEMDVIYWRKDGTSVVLPCSDILRFDGPKIQELRIFEDANPLFDASLPVGPRASVFTQSEGRRAVAPGVMRRYFTEHAEGIHRAANGYPPKWSLAGPRWPMLPKMDILDALQGAIAAGRLVRSAHAPHRSRRVAGWQPAGGRRPAGDPRDPCERIFPRSAADERHLHGRVGARQRARPRNGRAGGPRE